LLDYQCSLRLDVSDGHELAGLSEVRVGCQTDVVADGQVLQRRHDSISIVNVSAKKILNPFMGIETARPCPI
jgi:hypothetical protein